MDDQAIAALFADRSEGALDALSDKYGRLCRMIAGNILSDPRDAEECVNDSLLEIWNRLQGDRPANLTAYVCRIVRHVALNRLEYNRAAKRTAELVPLEECEDVFPDESLRPDTNERELGEIISRYLKAQKPDRANLFIRHCFFCESVKAIAKSRCCTEAKVRSQLARMRAELKEILKKEGYDYGK